MPRGTAAHAGAGPDHAAGFEDPVARRRPDFPATPASDPHCALLQPVHEIGPLTLRLVAGAPVSRLWNEYVQRYHYLGYTAMSGS